MKCSIANSKWTYSSWGESGDEGKILTFSAVFLLKHVVHCFILIFESIFTLKNKSHQIFWLQQLTSKITRHDYALDISHLKMPPIIKNKLDKKTFHTLQLIPPRVCNKQHMLHVCEGKLQMMITFGEVKLVTCLSSQRKVYWGF